MPKSALQPSTVDYGVMQGLSPDWTAEDRLLVIAALLPGMQADISAGRYSAIGRPNVTTLQHVLTESVDVLEPFRAELEPAIQKLQARCASEAAATPPPELEADPSRASLPETGIFVRAKRGDGWGAVDISHLRRDSLIAWLHSRDGLAERTLLLCFGHQREG